jgi:glycolate oxidase FAD binding subunit
VDLMAVATALELLQEEVRAASVVLPVGARTHWEVANPPVAGRGAPDRGATTAGAGGVGTDAAAVEVRAPGDVVAYAPADLTVTVGGGLAAGDLEAVLREHGQECVLDPRSPHATVGGVLATGLSGPRRLRHGPLRDRVLEVRFVNAAGEVVKGGGPTVKNVSGFDIPRLLVGSLGTIGAIAQVTLRCQPTATAARWGATDDDPVAVLTRAYRPSSVLWDGRVSTVLVEGVVADIDAETRAMGLTRADTGPALPDGPHRGRISIRPSRVRAVAPALDAAGVRWLAEVGVGTVHVASDTEGGLAAARVAAEAHGGWLLREAGAPGLDGFGAALPNARLQERIRAAFDPTGKFSPGRLPT